MEAALSDEQRLLLQVRLALIMKMIITWLTIILFDPQDKMNENISDVCENILPW